MAPLKAQKQTFTLKVQGSASNVVVHLPSALRRMFNIEVGDVLTVEVDPLSKTPMVVTGVEKQPTKGAQR